MELTERLTWRGREVAWTRLGEGPPVVFCHGTPWSSEIWGAQARALSRTHRVYLWDMPGFGRSSKDAAHSTDLATQGELFAHLLDEWGLEAPHVIAHDIGGAVALRAHLLHGRPYAGLCLVDVVTLRPWGSAFYGLVHENEGVMAQLPSRIHEGALRAYISGAAHRPLPADVLDALTAPWLGDVGQAAFYRQIAHADPRHTDDVEHRLGEVATPVHIVWGAEDAWIPATQAPRLRAEIPGSSLTVVPDAGHLIHYDAPVALADEIRRWIDAPLYREHTPE